MRWHMDRIFTLTVFSYKERQGMFILFGYKESIQKICLTHQHIELELRCILF